MVESVWGVRRNLKRAIIPSGALILVAVLVSCGGYSNPSSSTTTTPKVPPSKITKRVFLTNAFNSGSGGEVDILDAARDTFQGSNSSGTNVTTITNSVITVNQGASLIVLTPDKTFTLVFESTGNTVSIITNATEALAGSITLPGATESMVIGTDNKTVYAAMRNAPTAVTGGPLGSIGIIDLTGQDLSSTINIAEVHRIVMSHNGNKLLAFSDDSDALTVVDTTASPKTTTTVTGFDRPVWGVFNSDDSKAYILSCGPECGGTAAKVTVLDMASLTPGASIPVSAATMGLLDGSNLYVAGTGAGGGKLDVIDTGAFKVSKSGVSISDGYHTLMALASNNQLYIGAKACSGTSSCLSIYKTSSQSASVVPVVCSTVSTANNCAGDVTGLQPITGRNIVYVVEGGELLIFDTTTGKPQTTQIDIVGKAFDVKAID